MLLALFLSAPADAGSSGVSCQTAEECWLDPDGKAIKRPAKFRGRQHPRGDCGKNLVWLRNRLSCEENICVVTHIGDKC